MRAGIHRIRDNNHLYSKNLTVCGPNYPWHVDGNHKLTHYKLVIHEAIDGFSRLITFTHCADNNRAETVLGNVMSAIQAYGIPSRIRTDLGGENIEIWRYITHIRGEGRQSYIAGSNTRIEHLWRDVRTCVVSIFREICSVLEDTGVLNVENDRHVLPTVCVYSSY